MYLEIRCPNMTQISRLHTWLRTSRHFSDWEKGEKNEEKKVGKQAASRLQAHHLFHFSPALSFLS